MWKDVVQIATQLSWLFIYVLYQFELPAKDVQSLSSTVLYRSSKPAGNTTTTTTNCEEECAVCLCKLEEGEEITELRCAHLFHKTCLDRWTGLNHVTCPLCRRFLAPPASTESQFHQIEVIRLRFSSSRSDRDRDTWWLR